MSNGFKKCRSCGARNKERFDDCVRCGKPLAPVGPESSLSLKLNKLTLVVAGVVALGIGVVAFRWMATETEDEAPSASSSQAPVPEANAVTSSPTSEASGGFQEAREATRLGMEAFQRGDYAAARSHFEELARLSPTNVTAYLYSGLSSMQLGELHLAEDDLRRAVELDPTHQGAVDSLVNLLIQKGALGEAAEVQSEFARRNRFDAEPLIGLGRIHRAQGDMASALEAHRRAVELAPSNAMALLELGVSLNQASETGEARDVFIEVLELDNTNAPAYAGLGTTLVMEQRYSEAIEPLEMALQLDDDQAPAHLNLAIAYENLDRVEDSLREYEAFVRLTDDREKAARVGELVKRARAALEERQGQK